MNEQERVNERALFFSLRITRMHFFLIHCLSIHFDSLRVDCRYAMARSQFNWFLVLKIQPSLGTVKYLRWRGVDCLKQLDKLRRFRVFYTNCWSEEPQFVQFMVGSLFHQSNNLAWHEIIWLQNASMVSIDLENHKCVVEIQWLCMFFPIQIFQMDSVARIKWKPLIKRMVNQC